MIKEAFQEAIKSMRNNESRLERAGDYCSDENQERLRQMFDEGIGISKMALRLQRTVEGLPQRAHLADPKAGCSGVHLKSDWLHNSIKQHSRTSQDCGALLSCH